MATTTEQVKVMTDQKKMPPWYLKDLYRYLSAFAVLTVIYMGFRIYQGAYGVSTGLDSTEPVFETHWMRLLDLELVVIVLFASIAWGWLWLSRDKNLDKTRTERRNSTLFYADHVHQRLHLCGVLGR